MAAPDTHQPPAALPQQPVPAGTPEHGWLERALWLPFLRWFDRRVRRAVDGSAVAQSVDHLRMAIEALTPQFAAVQARVQQANDATAGQVHALNERIGVGIGHLSHTLQGFVDEAARRQAALEQREADMRLREDAMQLRVAALGEASRAQATVLLAALRGTQDALAALGTDLGTDRTAVTALHADVAACRSAIHALAADLDTGRAAAGVDVAEVRAAIETLGAGLEAGRTAAGADAAQVRAAIEALGSDLAAGRAAAGADVAEVRSAIGSLGSEVAGGIASLDARATADRAAAERGLAEWIGTARETRGDIGALLRGAEATDARLAHVFANTELALQRFFVPFDDAFAVRTDMGYLLVPRTDVSLAVTLVEAHGALERGTLQVILRLLREGDTMIDVGANIGTMAIPAAKTVGPTGRVIALEPTPQVADLLARSAALNGVGDRLSITRGAAGATDGTIDFGLSDRSTMNGPLTLDDVRIIQVPVHRLDTLVDPATPVRLVKIDVEGAELAVLAGMRELIARNRDMHIIVEFAPTHFTGTGTSAAEWIAAFTALGFSGHEISEADGTTVPLRTTGFDDVFSMNILFSPRGAETAA